MKKLIQVDDIVCKICDTQFKRVEDLSRHLKSHNITSSEYSKIYLLNNIIPKCHCGCGNEVIINGFNINEYIRGHTGGGNWQTKYQKDSVEFKAITEKISKNVIEYFKDNPKEVSQETRVKISEHMKIIMNDEDEKNKRFAKMKETKQKQSELGILSERHWTRTWPEHLVDEKLKEMGEKSSKTKQERNIKAWNVGLTNETDDRILKWSGENNYRFNPNKKVKYSRKFRNKEFRQILLDLQENCCFKCKKGNIQLCLHHVDEDKTNDVFDNLIFVCRSCHIRLHSVPKFLREFQNDVYIFKNEIKNKKE